MNWFYNNVIILIKYCKIPYKNLDKALLFSKKHILSENLTSSNYPTVQYFFAETSHRFPTHQCLQKGMWDFLYFVYILSYLQKLKRPGFY